MAGIISINELNTLISSNEDFILIDVREKNELHYGMIPKAVNLPLSEFETAVQLSESDFKKKYGFSLPKNKLIVLYCRTGNRSGRAAEYLEKKGINVKNFKGSVQEWSKTDEMVKFY